MSTTFIWLIIISEQGHNTCNTSAFEKVKILDHALKHAALLTSKKNSQPPLSRHARMFTSALMLSIVRTDRGPTLWFGCLPDANSLIFILSVAPFNSNVLFEAPFPLSDKNVDARGRHTMALLCAPLL